MESVRLDQILLLVQSKSGEVTLKQKIVGLPPDFCWTSVGLLMVLRQKRGKI